MKACIFDLDGTLTDTVETLAYFVNTELAKYDFPAIASEKFKTMAGNGARKLIQRALACHLQNWEQDFEDKVLEEYNSNYDANFTYLTTIYDGMPELLNELKKREIKLAVLTNKPQPTAIKNIEYFFGKDVFDLVLGQRDGFPIKPDPAGVYEIMSKLGVVKDECLYIGDTATDMKTGKGAGLFTVGVLWGFRELQEIKEAGADAIVKHPLEILKLV